MQCKGDIVVVDIKLQSQKFKHHHYTMEIMGAQNFLHYTPIFLLKTGIFSLKFAVLDDNFTTKQKTFRQPKI